VKTFREFIIAEATDRSKNTHLLHIEDLVLYGGVKGAREAINSLRSVSKMLRGHTDKKFGVTVKWDGAPAVFAGTDPSDGKFFVAKKGLFNKNPKLYKSVEEVKADTSGDLAKKLTIAFNELSKLGIRNIIQGDIMYTRPDLKTVDIDGEKHYTFHPNTILYAVPVNSDLGKRIAKSKIGVVWHTEYRGSSIEKLKASFSPDLSYLKTPSTVWYTDADFRDETGQALFTKSESDNVQKLLSDAGKIFQKISGTTLREIESNPAFAQDLETFHNSLVRRGEKIDHPEKRVDALISWAREKHTKNIDAKKSERGKASAKEKMDAYMSFFSPKNKKNLALVYELQNKIVDAKLAIIQQLEKTKSLKTFLKKKDGFEVTGQEGFVAVDHVNGAVKLVDRLKFSYANFSPDIIKGWDH